MNLLTAASVVDGHVVGGDAVFEQVATDTRKLQGGELFIALQGNRFDGQDFVAEAKRSGAVAVMANRQVEIDIPTLVVSDTMRSLGQLAMHWREQFDIPMVAVTGSNGKTTVREMIARITEVDKTTLVAEANFNNHIGLPLTLLKLRDFHDCGVVELGMNHSGEIAYLSKIAQPTVTVITNAASAHLEGIGDVTGVARAKAEIFLGLQRSGAAVINADDRFAAYWLARGRRYRTVTFGLDNRADVSGEVASLEGAIQLEIQLPEETTEVTLNLLGRHNARNALAAAAVAWSMGCDAERIKAGLEKIQPVKGRLQPKSGRNESYLIDDSYNANPASLHSAIQVLARKSGDRILVLGNMAELGMSAESFHRAAGQHAREIGIERLLTTGDLARLAGEEFGVGATHFDNREALSQAALELMGPHVSMLIKGSRGAQMETVVDALTEEGSRQC